LQEIRGKKSFQKLCYFLQEVEGLKLGARFRMRHFGPYSEELDELLEDLDELRVVSVTGSSEEGFQISCGAKYPDDFHAEAEVQRAIDRLLKGLGYTVNQGLTLEVMATAHFLAQGLEYQGTDDDKNLLVDRVRAWKGSKFKSTFIRENIDRLEMLGYLPAA
jgi:hypothetical protein